ncbi:MAG: aspartate aminotransferase family protein [Mesorhizobium sp.]|uniref:aminotransferase family protein n=1 Tax=Mesorhizobium sp. TaxID=1871066 RepID=UPI000FE573BE|nr:aminotransferase class III-fold pyridoxal phosphate-dependent enzyme [Mesorhizobium sp.]RWN53647.1 MAG: aspartate aminotransferase family protein [Mesorhizobium sp.]RWN62914.1 MAG: aspartate aminotransferase family protein [Mesorhizobium sp.]TIR29069.1 MAG: aspartate aminotransferase family protein [Mesorhizobium sp.]
MNFVVNPGMFQDAFFGRDGSAPVPLMIRAEGIWMFDEHGKAYIDGSSGPIASNIGHANERVAHAMYRQAMTLDYAYPRVARHAGNAALTGRLCSLAGAPFERVGLASGGSEAMDLALKFLRQYAVAKGLSSKRILISNMPSYHGASIGTLAISGDESLEPFLSGFAVRGAKVPAPMTYRGDPDLSPEEIAERSVAALEYAIVNLGPENVLAYVVEPVGGVATGCLVPPSVYFRRIRELCDRYGVFLVFDEILCGAGRTGKFLAAHHLSGCIPDVIVVAKGIAAGYSPLGAVLLPAEPVDELAKLTGFNFSHTYSANPISCAAALAVLDEYEDRDLITNASQTGQHLGQTLRQLMNASPIVGDVRGIGLLYAVELVADKESKAQFPYDFNVTEVARTEALKQGLIIYSRRTSGGKYGDWFIVAPPLTVTPADCDQIGQRLELMLEGVRHAFQAAGGVAGPERWSA